VTDSFRGCGHAQYDTGWNAIKSLILAGTATIGQRWQMNRHLLKLLVEMNGIEPSTYALRTHRSPS
jgi:hypothetical protein